MKWYLQAINKYAVFSGRARRKEYWMFNLFLFIFAFAALVIDNIAGTTFKFNVPGTQLNVGLGYLYLSYALATIVPSLAVTVRRLHDIGKSGWFYLIALIPYAGAICLIVLMCIDGVAGENQYGPNPKENQE